MKAAQRIAAIPPSPTLSISTKAAELKAAGKDIVSFSAGEPDFDTPAEIREAATAAMNSGQTHYTAVGGSPALKKAIADFYEAKIGVRYAPNEIIASSGAKHSLYNLFLSLLEPGDEVIVPAPYWVSYPTQIRIAEGVPVPVLGLAENGFLPTIEDLEAAVTSRTRAIVINNPTNPTGAFWSRDDLKAIAEWLVQRPDLIVISDAIYDELVYDNADYAEIIELAPELRDRYFIVNGVSKAFAMTGWRLGYTLGPAPIIKGMQTLQSQSTSNPSSITQAATIAALAHSKDVVAPLRECFARRRDVIVELLQAIDGVKLHIPKGAFYVFPDFSAFIGRKAHGKVIEDDMALAAYLLDEAGVAVVPGSAFGAPGFLRMSYASSDLLIRKGMTRIAEALQRLH